MFAFLLILAIIISMIIIAMVAYGIYFIIASFQTAYIILDIEDLWGVCSYAYCFMDEKKKKNFAERLEKELHRTIHEVGEEENKIEINRIARLKETKEYIIELYEKLIKRIEKAVPLARECSDEEFYEIEDVVNIIKEVLSEI